MILKNLLALALISSLGLKTCEDPGEHIVANQENNIALSIPMYPSPFTMKYVVDNGALFVHQVHRTQNTDSIVFQTALTSVDYSDMVKAISNLDKDEYVNKCVEDGQVFTLVLTQNDTISRQITVSNKYNEEFGKMVTAMNTELPDDKKIYYDKDSLEQLPQTCN
ncbi:hypothetical protein [Gilvibacter sp.]|uniref:hypothetical protein n=1 Tax=Gilvibacter sp. TaxID=2729997 RepID=UPI003F4A3EBF